MRMEDQCSRLLVPQFACMRCNVFSVVVASKPIEWCADLKQWYIIVIVVSITVFRFIVAQQCSISKCSVFNVHARGAHTKKFQIIIIDGPLSTLRFFFLFISGLSIYGCTMYVFVVSVYPGLSCIPFHAHASLCDSTFNSNYTVNIFKCYRLHALETMQAHLALVQFQTDHHWRIGCIVGTFLCKEKFAYIHFVWWW